MARINIPSSTPKVHTHGGAVATRIHNPTLQLRRLVMGCMLWEDQFYIDGVSTANLIAEVVPQCKPTDVAEIAITARNKAKLRHVPLLLVRELARWSSTAFKQGKPHLPGLVENTLAEVIQRPDELAEFLAIYWKDGKQPLSAQVKKGLALAFGKFNEYSLAKYNRDGAIKLRDVMFLTHPNPHQARLRYEAAVGERNKVEEFESLYKRLAEGTLETPDTWEVALSGGADKREVFTRLIQENKLGALALLRNLRNMLQAGVGERLIASALETMRVERVLPFRFITAARYAAKLEPQLEQAMFRCVADMPKLTGKTVVIVDVSGSMNGDISGKSELTRMDAAAALTMLIRELSSNCVVYCTAGSDHAMKHSTALVPARRGFALRDLISKAMVDLGGGGIFLTQCVEYVTARETDIERLIVITDEQDTDRKLNPSKAKPTGKFNYILNIAAYQNGIGAQDKWDKVDGFSEGVIDYIMQLEAEGLNLQK